MAGAGFKMDLSKLQRLAGGAARMQQSQALCEELGELLVTSTRQRFKDEKTHRGNPWPKSRRAEEEGGQTLTDTAKLKNSVGYEATTDTVAVGTNDVRAAIHNYGGEIEPKQAGSLAFSIDGRLILAKKVEMPQRQFIGISTQDKEDSRDTIKDFMQVAMGLK